MDPLDNPVWHSLTGRLAPFADPSASQDGPAIRFDPAVGVFSAAHDRLDADGWAELARLAGPGAVVVLFRRSIPSPPDGWRTVYDEPCSQMVFDGPSPGRDPEATTLGAGDVADMIALVEATKPGPFALRTHELGRYVGVRHGDRLVAMAGERFAPPGHTEISAVCTHPDARGRGLAARLTGDVVSAIAGRGEVAFLHVVHTNLAARRVYERLGFRERATLQVRAFVTPARDAGSAG